MTELIPGLVSTIIPVHNRPQMLQAAVSSVLQQTYRPIEILIVDDGSTDGTAAVAHSLVAKYSATVRVLSQENKGAGPAREHGRLNARGEFIQYLDSDDRLLANKFNDQVDALRKHPDCGIAYGIARLVDNEGKVLADPFKWTGRQLSQLFPSLLVDRWWCTHSPLYRRSVCDQAGPWTDLRYSQDWELDARIGALKVKLVNTNTIVSEHVSHSDSRQTGGGKWLEPPEQVRFFHSLYESARKAGVTNSVPEMQHFSRWVFAQARKCGAMGDSASAQNLYELAIGSAVSPGLDMRLVAIMSKAVGWTVTGKGSQFLDKLKVRKFGPRTKSQSWMDSA